MTTHAKDSRKAFTPPPIDLEKLEQMATEKGMSSFEVFMRQLPVEICSCFLDTETKIIPGRFVPAGLQLTSSDSEKVNRAFPNTVAAHQNQLLRVARGTELDTLPSQAPAANKKVLVLFSGGPAAGGNNVIVGLFKALGPRNKLFGVKAGPGGLLKGTIFEITENDIRNIVNMGGFDFLGSDRTKIETEGQFQQVIAVCREQEADAIVVVGGDDSNTNAAFLAERLFANVHADGRGVQVIGVPKTIDGDLQLPGLLDISFGFDTATKIYSELVGNIAQDTPSSRKYWHFIKVMGRAASQVALEVALQVRPAITLISEEIAAKGLSLAEIIDGIVKTIVLRVAKGLKHGVVLIPEGLIEFIPEMTTLINELNAIIGRTKDRLASRTDAEKKELIRSQLSPAGLQLLNSLPEDFQNMLLLDRDDHGNLPVSQIQTEKLLVKLCNDTIMRKQQDPDAFPFLADFTEAQIKSIREFKFAVNEHFLGYEGRCGTPSKFDIALTTNLGLIAGSLICDNRTGYMAGLTDLDKGGTPLAIPLTGLLNVETRGGSEKLVIKKALVDMTSNSFLALKHFRAHWASEDYFHSTGPRQYLGPRAVTDRMPASVMINRGYANTRYNLGKEILLFQDRDARIITIMNGIGVPVTPDNFSTDMNGILRYEFTAPKAVTINAREYPEGARLVINQYGEVFMRTPG